MPTLEEQYPNFAQQIQDLRFDDYTDEEISNVIAHVMGLKSRQQKLAGASPMERQKAIAGMAGSVPPMDKGYDKAVAAQEMDQAFAQAKSPGYEANKQKQAKAFAKIGAAKEKAVWGDAEAGFKRYPYAEMAGDAYVEGVERAVQAGPTAPFNPSAVLNSLLLNQPSATYQAAQRGAQPQPLAGPFAESRDQWANTAQRMYEAALQSRSAGLIRPSTAGKNTPSYLQGQPGAGLEQFGVDLLGGAIGAPEQAANVFNRGVPAMIAGAAGTASFAEADPNQAALAQILQVLGTTAAGGALGGAIGEAASSPMLQKTLGEIAFQNPLARRLTPDMNFQVKDQALSNLNSGTQPVPEIHALSSRRRRVAEESITGPLSRGEEPPIGFARQDQPMETRTFREAAGALDKARAAGMGPQQAADQWDDMFRAWGGRVEGPGESNQDLARMLRRFFDEKRRLAGDAARLEPPQLNRDLAWSRDEFNKAHALPEPDSFTPQNPQAAASLDDLLNQIGYGQYNAGPGKMGSTLFDEKAFGGPEPNARRATPEANVAEYEIKAHAKRRMLNDDFVEAGMDPKMAETKAAEMAGLKLSPEMQAKADASFALMQKMKKGAVLTDAEKQAFDDLMKSGDYNAIFGVPMTRQDFEGIARSMGRIFSKRGPKRGSVPYKQLNALGKITKVPRAMAGQAAKELKGVTAPKTLPAVGFKAGIESIPSDARRLLEVDAFKPKSAIKAEGDLHGGTSSTATKGIEARIAMEADNVPERLQQSVANLAVRDADKAVGLLKQYPRAAAVVKAQLKEITVEQGKLVDILTKRGRPDDLALAHKIKQNVGKWLHRQYNQGPAPEVVKQRARDILARRTVEGTNRKMNPQEIEAFIQRVQRGKEYVQAPTLGKSGTPGTAPLRKRLIDDPVVRLLRGERRNLGVINDSLAKLKIMNHRFKFLDDTGAKMDVWRKLSPDVEVKMPDWPFLGPTLQGKMVPQWYRDMLVENFGMAGEGPAEELANIALVRGANKIMTWFKKKNTVFNPAGQKTQALNNFFNLTLAGNSPLYPGNRKAHRLARQQWFLDSTGRISKKFAGKSKLMTPEGVWVIDALEQAGAIEGASIADYSYGTKRMMDRAMGQKDPLGVFQGPMNLVDRGALKAGNAYNFWDQHAKISTYIKARGMDGGRGIQTNAWSKHKKLSHDEAIRYINDYFINYQKPSKLISLIRRIPLSQLVVNPYISSKLLSLPIWARAMVHQPIRAMSALGLIYGSQNAWWHMQGMAGDEEAPDVDTMEKMRPSYERAPNKLPVAIPNFGDDAPWSVDFGSGVPSYEIAKLLSRMPGMPNADGTESLAGNFALATSDFLGEQFLSGPLASSLWGKYATDIVPERPAEEQVMEKLLDLALVPGGQTYKVKQLVLAMEGAPAEPGTKRSVLRAGMGIGGFNVTRHDAALLDKKFKELNAKDAELSRAGSRVKRLFMKGEIDIKTAVQMMERLSDKKLQNAKKVSE